MSRRAVVVATASALLVLAASAVSAVTTGTSTAGTTIPSEATGIAPGPIFYVATDGRDTDPGTIAAPWRTIQHAADVAPPGAEIDVRGGVYRERVTVHVDGSPGLGPIVFRNYPGETPVIDGSGMQVPQGDTAMVLLENRSYVTIQGFEIRNYRTAEPGRVPVGILVAGHGDHIGLLDNRVHDIETNWTKRSNGDAHGIAAYGTDAPEPIRDLVISGNELSNLKLGSSESLVVNGNVTDFRITNNSIHDNNNIGIDVIGYEGTAPDPTYDAARNGIIAGNTVYNIDSYGNPAYGNDRSANGIYVDGGRDVLVERNTIHDVNIGMEFASEHAGRATSYVTARNNLVYHSTEIGVAMGGYDRRRGHSEDNVIVSNTFVDNGTELVLQFDTRDNTIENNIFVSGGGDFLENPYRENLDNVVNSNAYWSPRGPDDGLWQWRDTAYRSFASYVRSTGNDTDSRFAEPRFVDAAAGDYRLRSDSSLVDTGASLPTLGGTDLGGDERVSNGSPDIGADELAAPSPSPTPSISGTTTPITDLTWTSVRNGWGPAEENQSNGEKKSGDGQPITVGGKAFETGLGVHAPSAIRYALDGSCAAFLSDVGVDGEVGTRGSIEFQVWGDGEKLADSGVVSGSQPPVGLYADLAGVQTLRLVVTDAGNGNAYDHADWANARIACRP